MNEEKIVEVAEQSESCVIDTPVKTTRSRWWWLFALVIILGSSILYTYVRTLNKPPLDFPVNTPITIEKGVTAKTITRNLALAGVVRSEAYLYYLLVLNYDPTTIKASTYVFDRPMTADEVAKRLTEGDFDTNLVRLTHIEGESVVRLASRAAPILPTFNAEQFILSATPHEGHLFPETYFIPITYDEEALLGLMLSTYEQKTAGLTFDISSSTLSEDDVLVLASIVEREANSLDSMKMVSGILQNRLSIGMPLQADASIEYVLDKPLAELTPEDLEMDSPYNTYKNTGLPPTPIGNPGLEAIMAVLEPTLSDYFYYITDEGGEFHYAETYDEHLLNVERHLR